MADGSSSSFSHGEVCDTLWARVVRAIRRTDTSTFDPRAPKRVLEIDGMSGTKFRIFINELLYRYTKTYLEVGVWKGSTFCNAIFGNLGTVSKAICVDDWSGFGGPKGDFLKNLDMALASDSKAADRVKVINEDFFKTKEVTDEDFRDCQIYFFDGPHKKEDHKKSITHVASKMSDEFILVVDDWNWLGVREGTLDGLEECGFKVYKSVEIRSSVDNEHVKDTKKAQKQWWNGCWIAVVSRTESSGEKHFFGPDKIDVVHELV